MSLASLAYARGSCDEEIFASALPPCVGEARQAHIDGRTCVAKQQRRPDRLVTVPQPATRISSRGGCTAVHCFCESPSRGQDISCDQIQRGYGFSSYLPAPALIAPQSA